MLAVDTDTPVRRGRGGVRPARRRLERPRVAPWLFVGPAVVLFATFFAYPLMASFLQSFQARRGGGYVWVGLQQYERLLTDPVLAQSLVNTLLILVVQVPLMIAVALVLAQVVNQSWLRFRSGYRLIFFLPAVTTLVAYAIVFRVMLQTDGGVINQALGALHLPAIAWLDSPTWSRLALIASLTWRWTGYNMVILLAGLQAIPREQYESASIDGAGPARTFLHVVIPQLRPVILFTTVTSTIGTMQLFDEPFILTEGGPANATVTPVLYLYRVGFEQLDFPYASAIAWLVVAIIGILSYLQFKMLGRER